MEVLFIASAASYITMWQLLEILGIQLILTASVGKERWKRTWISS